jgi:AraC family transcriptional regulator, transcriptional activator of pobA
LIIFVEISRMTIQKLESVAQFNSQRGQETLHPLVSVLDQSKSKPVEAKRYLSEIYIIFLKDVKCEDFQYGRNKYDYQDESLLFIAPGQVFGFDLTKETLIQPRGWALVFHPDFIRGTALGKKITEYGFFSYDVTEALHISKRERQIVLECFKKIKEELQRNIDKHTVNVIVSNIELLLNYCLRFYDRQFITRAEVNKDILTRFEALLKGYYESDLPTTTGLPTVAYCASELALSANYFGDLVKKETGKTALEYIQEKVVDLAKERLLDESKSVSEVAFEMGYKYPQHFTRLFKQRVGMSPQEYRSSN